jgi:Tol biopolymer transport system component
MRARLLHRVLALAAASLLLALTGVAGAAPDVSTGRTEAQKEGGTFGPPIRDQVGEGAWAPDGRTVTFARVLKRRTLLMVVDVVSGRTRTIAELPRDPDRVAESSFSSDGRLIGVVVYFRLYVFDTRGRVVLDGLRGVRSFAFSPTGDQVAITPGKPPYYGDGVSPPRPPPRVVVFDLQSRQSRQLTKNGLFPHWSSLGDWIVFVRERPHPDSCDLYVIRPNGAGAHRLVRSVCDYRWSADGTRFAAFNGAFDIYEFRRDGRLGRRLRHDVRFHSPGDAGWTPSGRFVVTSERLSRVLDRHYTATSIHLSPDGRRVVFRSDWACKNRRLWIGSAATGRVKRLTRGC